MSFLSLARPVKLYTALKHAAPCLRELCVRGCIRGLISVVLALACPAVGKFSRASSAGGRPNLRSSIKQPDRVGRRGLFEPREDFSRLLTYAWAQMWFVQNLAAD